MLLVYPESFISKKPLITSDTDFGHELCGKGAEFVNGYKFHEVAIIIMNLLVSEEKRKKLITRGQQQLQDYYPSPKEKWKSQLELIQNAIETQITQHI